MNGVIKFALALLIIIGLAYLGWRIYEHYKNKNSVSGTSTVSQYEKSSQSPNNTFLNNKDYSSYINSQVVIAGDYLSTQDNNSAERVMNDVFAKVPAGNLNSTAYYEMVSVQQATKNNEKYKYYLVLLIKQLKKEGDAKGAAAMQALLDQTK